MSNTSINNNSDNKLSHPECRRGEQVCCSVCSVRAGTRRNWWKRRCKGTYMPGCRACPLARPISQGFLRRAHQNSEKYREQTEGTRTGYFTSGRCVLLCLQRSHRDSRKLVQTAVQRHAHAWVPVLVPRPFSRSTNLPADSQMRFISNVAVVPSCANASGLYDGVLKIERCPSWCPCGRSVHDCSRKLARALTEAAAGITVTEPNSATNLRGLLQASTCDPFLLCKSFFRL